MKNLHFWQKTYLLTLLLFLLALFGGILFIGWQNHRQMMNREMEKSRNEQNFIAQSFAWDAASIQSNIRFRVPILAKSYGTFYAQDGILLQLWRGDELLFGNLPTSSIQPSQPSLQENTQYWMTREFDGVLYSVVSSRLPGGDYTLTCARSLQPLTETSRQMRSTLSMGGLSVSVLLAIGLFFVLRSLSKPLERVANVADRFAKGDFCVRAVQKGNDEIGNLADSFNAMAETAQQHITEIQEIAQQNERMAANLSHEIRTPLTAIQGYAEYMLLAQLTESERNTALQYITEESARLRIIAQRMLQLAALRHEDIPLEPLELAEVLHQVALSVKPKAAKSGVTITLGPIDTMWIQGDAILLESLMTNLLDNAISACTEGGQVVFSATHTAEKIIISVEDNGCGLTHEEVEKLGEPFYRPDKARNRAEGGAGLGVALCYQIATLHQARLRYESTLHKGTTAIVEFTAL